MPESRADHVAAAEDRIGQNSAAQALRAPAAATAIATPATVSANPTSNGSDEPRAEKVLRNQGYKPTMVHGEMKFCRREMPLGSFLPTVRRCVTVAEAELMARESREIVERFQRSTLLSH